MKKATYLLIFCSLLSLNQLFAQSNRSLQEFYTDYYMERVKSISKPLTYNNIDGSPYLKEEFQEGTIFMKDQKKYTVPLRFNLYASNFEFKVDDKIITIDNPNNIAKIEFDNSSYIYYQLKKRNSFVELIAPGKNSLICKKIVVLKEAVPAGAYKEPKPASFSRKDDLYYIVNEKNEQFLVKSKKSLKNIFTDRQEEIAKFIKKEKISHRKKADLKKLVEYYNTL